VSPAETAVAEAGQSSTQQDVESDDEESLAQGAQASSSYNVSDGCGTTADQGDTTSRFSNGSDSKSQPVDGISGTEQIVQVPALVQNLTGDPGTGVSVDSPFAHEVPLPFPGSNHTSSMLSINLEALEFGTDRRTTVMLVKIPKSCQPDRFLGRLRDLNLLTKVRFYYMPMNAARNRPCGYIFLDLEDSEDVVRLCKNLRLLDNLLGARQDRKIQVNFARIQGWRALLQHFCGSELMFEPDANRRPQFFFPPRIGKSSSGNCVVNPIDLRQ
ncbi:ML5, partial [Symbiodinium sp. CCMP2456]